MMMIYVFSHNERHSILYGSHCMATLLCAILLSILSMAQAGSPASIGSNNQTSDSFAKSTESSSVGPAILFSIGGVFISFIIMAAVIGVVKTYRQPERYGPRGEGSGRPMQSRARGLARAMLDTIPIVKFSETYDSKADQAVHGDVELANTGEAKQGQTSTSDKHSATSPSVPVLPAAGGLYTIGPDITVASSSLGCSICVEDFVQNEDVRVLPCNHKFHPSCVDPWLLNISGTCPLCRIDLRSIANTSYAVADSANNSLPPPLLDETHNAALHRSHISNFKDLYHIALSRPEEGIVALRLYQENRRASLASTAIERIANRESRLTSMLRDTFSVQTWRSDVLETLTEQA